MLSGLGRIVTEDLTFDPTRLKVVVASDDQRLRAELIAFVREVGCVCVEAADSLAALDFLTVNRDFNVLIADVQMSKIDGVELVQRSRVARGAGVFLGGILISPDIDPAVTVRALHARASDLVLRPQLREHLKSAIMRVYSDLTGGQQSPLVDDNLHGQIGAITSALHRLNQRLQKIAQGRVAELAGEFSAPDEDEIIERAQLLETVRRLIRDRKLRGRHFPEARFGEPAWDILLDLTLAELEGNLVSVSSLCIASGAPMSTATRWIAEMVSSRLVERLTDPTDGRRNFVKMAPATMQAMLKYLAAITAGAASSKLAKG